jgi:hypothetical protein
VTVICANGIAKLVREEQGGGGILQQQNADQAHEQNPEMNGFQK